MSLKHQRARDWINKRQRSPKRQFPLALTMLYGPNDQQASHLVVAIIEVDGAEPELVDRWVSEEKDIRRDDQVLLEVVDCLKARAVQRVLAQDGIVGCPHEEGVDYPQGTPCPYCPFWAGGELLDDAKASASSGEYSDDVPVTHSLHCQLVEREGRTLDVQIYRIPTSNWVLEVINEGRTSFVWDDEFDNDGDAWAEFQRTLNDEGLEAFADETVRAEDLHPEKQAAVEGE